MTSLPPITIDDGAVSQEERISAIDFVNRVNWLFETWDVDAIVDAFLPDSVTYHFHGTIRGEKELRNFFDNVYPYLVPGVSRHATNHIVDRDGEGVIVRYHNLLIRYAGAETAQAVAGRVLDSRDDLPAIWLYSAMTDRLRHTDKGWRILERHVGTTTTNARLQTTTTDPAYFQPYLPQRTSP